MVRPKADTVGSLVKNGEAVTMSIDERHPARAWRWRCSCGVIGQWSNRPRWYLVGLWEIHIKRWHPEVEEL